MSAPDARLSQQKAWHHSVLPSFPHVGIKHTGILHTQASLPLPHNHCRHTIHLHMARTRMQAISGECLFFPGRNRASPFAPPNEIQRRWLNFSVVTSSAERVFSSTFKGFFSLLRRKVIQECLRGISLSSLTGGERAINSADCGGRERQRRRRRRRGLWDSIMQIGREWKQEERLLNF